MNTYELSKNWFNWSFENPDKISPNHTALYFFIIDHSNRLGWKEKFGLPSVMAKEAIGIKSHNTYIKTFNDLVEWGFIKLIEKSKNQFTANIIAISNFDKAPTKALDKATTNLLTKQDESTDNIIKQVTNNNITLFDDFWKLYNKSVDKKKCMDKWSKLSDKEIKSIFEHLPHYIKNTPDKTYRKNPITYLNGKCWNDEEYLIEKKETYKPLIIHE